MAVHTQAIQKLYVAYFNRPADYGGLAHWEKVLSSTNGNLALATSAFAQSPEYQELIAGKSHEQIINQVYLNLFNREADPGGMAFWAARLREGRFSLDQIVKVIGDNASDTAAKDRSTYANKVLAATAFSAELDTAMEVIGYSGIRPNTLARTWLSTIGDTTSLNEAIAPEKLKETVRKIVEEGVIVEQGPAITLTSSFDTFHGTSGDDTFIGIVSADPGISTLQALDTIDGGAGVDRLMVQMDGSAVARPHTSGVEVIRVANTAEAHQLVLDLAASRDVEQVDASTASANLTVDLSAHAGVAVLVRGGAGDDTLVAGSNRAQLIGGVGKDLFVLTASASGAGTSGANSYSAVKDFNADDLLQLRWFNGTAVNAVGKFSQLGASLDGSTAVFSNYVDAAITQARAGEAVWFSYQGNAFVVVDSGAESAAAFAAGQDLIVQLTGVDLTQVSFNAQYGTIALV